MKIGVSYFGNVGAAYSSIGGDSSLSPADQAIVDNYKAGVAALNTSGGLAGCQVELVTYNFPASSPDFNTESQKECVAFTQDNKVIAVYSGAYETQVAVDCYAKAKVPFFASGGNYPPSCAELKKYAGFLYYAEGVGSCRAASFIDLWNKAGLFPNNAKVGILVNDDGTGQGTYVANSVYAPALKKLKVPYETYSFHGSTSTSDFANTNSALAPAILKFKTDGVNVVIFTPHGPTGLAAFMPQAQNQGFFPAYGLDTADSLQVAGALGAGAIKKGIGISWSITDLPLTVQQQLPTNTAITKCAAWAQPSQVALTGVNPYCDFLNLLEAGFANATNTTPASLQKGINALGTSFLATTTYGGATKFGKNVFGGASMAQMLTFDPTSKSWKYIAKNQKAVPIP